MRSYIIRSLWRGRTGCFILLVVGLSNSNKPKITGVKMVMINYAGVGS